LWPTAGGSLSQGTAQIQSVPANAAAANAAAESAGLAPPYDVASIQAAANTAAANFAAENQSIWSYGNNPSDPSTWAWYVWAALFGVGILVLVDVKR
jgi:hypothetical protein